MEISETSPEEERVAVMAVVERLCTAEAVQGAEDMFEHITSSPFDFTDDCEQNAAVVLFVERRIMLFARMMQTGVAPESLANLVYLSHFASVELGIKDIFAYLVDVCADDDLRGAMQHIVDDGGELDDEWNITARSSRIREEVEAEE